MNRNVKKRQKGYEPDLPSLQTVFCIAWYFLTDDMVKGSGYITSQCCGSMEIELETVYAAEIGFSADRLFCDFCYR